MNNISHKSSDSSRIESSKQTTNIPSSSGIDTKYGAILLSNLKGMRSSMSNFSLEQFVMLSLENLMLLERTEYPLAT
ncbi:MAG: hypothetical protein SFT93_02700 [Rickettsiaceae bacterium]|nr:hypothetical protein [Rickettsiaceae bacterium]